jgi:glycerol-3-phosphate dehydrogenase
VTGGVQGAAPDAGGPLDRRRADLARLVDERWDLLIVGGGITGAGAALDGVSRDLRVACIEREDIAAGTSSRSSRLIHGGLRYLEQLRFGLVREALAERSRLLRLAPHLVRLEPLLFPLYGDPITVRPFYGAGLTLYDLLGASRDGGRHRYLGVEAALEHTPVLRRARLRGAFVFHDGVEDDARYALAVARTARARGAVLATRLRAHGALRERGRIAGAHVRDELGGADLVIRARAVIDATGVWSGLPDGAFPVEGSATTDIRPSRGTHLIVRRDRIPAASGLTIRVPGKVVFFVPWPGHWLIGTTDLPYEGRPDGVVPTSDDVDEILAAVNRTLDVDLTRADLVGTYAGLRPLVGDGPSADGSTLRVSREHRVHVEPDGLTRIGGGKYTTYRIMARDAVDAAMDAAYEGAIRGGQGQGVSRPGPSATDELPIVGAAGHPTLDALVDLLTGRLAGAGLERRHAARLVARHGTQATDVVALGERLGLLQSLGPDTDHLEVEVAWAAREELALGVADVMVRRTRLAQELPDRGAAIAPRVAEILGAELGWTKRRRQDEVAGFLARAHQDFDVPAGGGTVV